MDSILSHRETNFLLVKIEKHGAGCAGAPFFSLAQENSHSRVQQFCRTGGDFFRMAVQRRKDNRRRLAALTNRRICNKVFLWQQTLS